MAKISAKKQTDRKQTLLNFAFQLNDKNCYERGIYSIPAENISTMPDEEWTAIMAGVANGLSAQAGAIKLSTAEPLPAATDAPLKTQDELIEETVSAAVVKLDMNMAVLLDFENETKGLVIKDVHDKEGYKVVKEAQLKAVKFRTTLDKRRKNEKDFYLQVGKKIDEKAKEYAAVIDRFEAPLDEKLKAYAELQQAEEKRQEEEASAALNKRVKELEEAGMAFNQHLYAIGRRISMDISSIKQLSEDEFAALLSDVQGEKAKMEEEEAQRIEAERIEEEKKEQEKKEMEARQRQLQEQEDQQRERQRQMDEEAATMRREKMQLRDEKLVNIGLVFNPETMAYEFKNNFAVVSLPKSIMEMLDNEEFSKMVEADKEGIKQAKEQQQEADEKEVAAREEVARRVKQLLELGMTHAPLAYFYPKATHLLISNDKVISLTKEEWENGYDTLANDVSLFEQQEKQRLADEESQRLQDQEDYNSRVSDVISIGMVQESGAFVFKNAWGDRGVVTILQLKDARHDIWDVTFSGIKTDVENIKQLTIDKDADKERRRQAALPEVDLVAEYVQNVHKAWMGIEITTPTTKSVADIYHEFESIINNACEVTAKKIAELKTKIDNA